MGKNILALTDGGQLVLFAADPEELREHVRKHLRGSRTPDRVVFFDELPTNATGKVLRRQIVEELRTATVEQ